MSKLSFFFSTMNAGKTTALLQFNYNCEEKNIKTLLFVPEISDKRGIMISRIGLRKKAIVINKEINIFKFVKNAYTNKNIKKVLIDEAQFLKKKNVFELISIVDTLRISVLTYGLRTDFKSNLFEGSKYLLALADEIIEMKSLCLCGRKATMNMKIDKKRKILTGNQIDINKKKYISLCRYHYYRYKLNKKI